MMVRVSRQRACSDGYVGVDTMASIEDVELWEKLPNG